MPDKARVVVVDDEPDVRAILARALSRQGFQCTTAANAEEALASIASNPPLLTITDVRMPGKDGIWLLRQLKERRPEMAVLMLTGVDDARTAVECLKNGADDYLTKPIDLDELHISAQRAIEKMRLIRENDEHRRNLEEKVKERTEQLNQAFRIIEKTYQSTLESLVTLPRLEEQHGSRKTAVESRDTEPQEWGSSSGDRAQPGATSDGRPDTPPPANESDSVEMATLRRAGALISRGASTSDVARAIATELVGRNGVRRAGLALRSRDGQEWEAVVDVGADKIPAIHLAEKAASDGSTRVENQGELEVVSVPLLVRGHAEGVWQICHDGTQREVVALAERLSFLLAASLARERDTESWQKAARALDLIYDMAGATRYSLDLHHVAQYVIDSLHKIVDYDAAGLLLLEQPPLLRIQTRFQASESLVAWLRNHMLSTLRVTCGVDVEEEVDLRVSRVNGTSEEPQEGPAKMRSFVNVPLSAGDGVAGLIHVSRSTKNAFSDEDISFIHRAANFLASSVEGVRDVLATVKGRIEQMVEHMTDGVLMVNCRGEVLAMNAAARSILQVDSAPGRPAAFAELKRVLEFDPLAVMQTERRVTRKGFAVRGVPYQALLSPVESADGELNGTVMAFRNFSEEKKIDEMKSGFIKTVSHEIRTPLTATKNAIALLAGPRLGELNPNQFRFLNVAKRNIEQLIEMVNDLLDVSKIEAGKMDIVLEPLHLGEAIESCLTGLRPHADEKGIALESVVSPDLPLVYGGSGAIQRILMNLVGNSLKFTDRGGTVRVGASPVGDGSDQERLPGVRVEVSDTGIGIPEDQLEAIFEKFHQVDDSRSGDVPGTGLGLTITRELVKAHHGRIWAESEPGQGSRFIFVIPVLSEDELFFRALGQDVDRAQKASCPLALLVIRLLNLEAVLVRIGEQGRQALVRSMEAAAENTTRRSSDRVLPRRESLELVVVLPDTPQEGGTAFVHRLIESMRSTLPSTHGGTATDFELNWGIAMFPEEAVTPKSLYQLASDRASTVVTT